MELRVFRKIAMALAAAALFGGGFAAGQARHGGQAMNHFSQPKTVLQVTLIKWRAGVPDEEKQKAIDGVKAMAAQIPGMKTIWLKTDRMQPRDWDAAFAIEFASRDAADDYALSPVHEKWEKSYLLLRENSLSPQLSNP
ncbi:MAG TPA: Dabb family protein [Candidatus Acidoferrales bacterium]|nr:Dabb family protein [Candidatus Acidoferrales bacterium]